jgi:hypothetical protein
MEAREGGCALRRTLILMLLLAILGGCGSEGTDDALAESMTGTWESKYGYIEFRDDGSYAAGNEVGSEDLEWGTWSTGGDVLTMVPAEDSRYCAGRTGTYVIEFFEDGNRLAATVEEDACLPRLSVWSLGQSRYTDAGA